MTIGAVALGLVGGLLVMLSAEERPIRLLGAVILVLSVVQAVALSVVLRAQRRR